MQLRAVKLGCACVALIAAAVFASSTVSFVDVPGPNFSGYGSSLAYWEANDTLFLSAEDGSTSPPGLPVLFRCSGSGANCVYSYMNGGYTGYHIGYEGSLALDLSNGFVLQATRNVRNVICCLLLIGHSRARR